MSSEAVFDNKELVKNIINICINYSKEVDDIYDYYLLSKTSIRHNYLSKKESIDDSYKVADLFVSLKDIHSNGIT